VLKRSVGNHDQPRDLTRQIVQSCRKHIPVQTHGGRTLETAASREQTGKDGDERSEMHAIRKTIRAPVIAGHQASQL